MIPALLAKIGIPVLAGVLAETLGGVNNPVAKEAAKALGNLDGEVARGGISPEQIAEANRHAEAVAALKLKEYETAMTEINQSLRAEVASEDAYVRRMRPTFGYLMAFTWALQMAGITYIMVFDTENTRVVIESAESLSLIWTVALSVLGIYFYRRSGEKKLSL